MTNRELLCLVRENRARANEWGQTVHREVIGAHYTYQEEGCNRHRILKSSIDSYVNALDRFETELAGSANPEAVANSVVEKIVVVGFSNIEREFRLRPTLTPRPRVIRNNW